MEIRRKIYIYFPNIAPLEGVKYGGWVIVRVHFHIYIYIYIYLYIVSASRVPPGLNDGSFGYEV